MYTGAGGESHSPSTAAAPRIVKAVYMMLLIQSYFWHGDKVMDAFVVAVGWTGKLLGDSKSGTSESWKCTNQAYQASLSFLHSN